MKKVIDFRIAEVIDKKKVLVSNDITNSFGSVFQHLTPTISTEFLKREFDPNELGDCFIQVGEALKKERYYIKDIELKSEIRERIDAYGKEFILALVYELTDKLRGSVE